jgi:hypothetical protein
MANAPPDLYNNTPEMQLGNTGVPQGHQPGTFQEAAVYQPPQMSNNGLSQDQKAVDFQRATSPIPPLPEYDQMMNLGNNGIPYDQQTTSF